MSRALWIKQQGTKALVPEPSASCNVFDSSLNKCRTWVEYQYCPLTEDIEFAKFLEC